MPQVDPSSAALLQQAGSAHDDEGWASQWAEVFTLMQQSEMEARAGEYAEAVVALKKNAESLLRQRATVQASCEQLLHTAYREAMQAHLKAMLEAASAGASQELIQAAARTVDELCPPELPGLQQGGPAWKAKQPALVQLGIGMPQPGVVMPPPKASGLMGLPGKASAAPSADAAASKAQPGFPQLGGQSFAQIGQFAAAAAAAQQEAAASQTQLWVGGLPDGIDEAMFRTLFARYGTIASVKLASGRREGYVKYNARDQAQAAIDALNGFECNGVKLSVRLSDAGSKPGGGLVAPFSLMPAS